jgi:hypothetical protein
LLAFTFFSIATLAQFSPSADRITQTVSVAEAVKIAGSVPAAARRAEDLGEADSGMRLESMALHIGLSAAQKTELDALLEAQQNPQSAQYHQWLTQEEYGARFGLTAADLSKVTGWLEAQGFTVKSIAPSRNLIMFSGAVAQAESAFGTKIHQYRETDGSTHIGNTTEIAIPKALAGVVSGVRGLSGFRPKPHAVRRAKPEFTSSVSGNHFLAPGDWATIYDVNAIYSAGYTGSGMHVAVAGQTYIPETDITAFRAAAGLSAPLLNMVCISTSVACTGLSAESVSDIGEADLDVEWSGGIAKNATVDFIYAAYDDPELFVFDSLVYGITTYKVGDAVVPVIGVSYGDCEYDVASYGNSYGSYGSYSSYDTYLAEAAGQGQTIVVSSGDEGAGCTTYNQSDTVAVNGASVSWPATNPNVTAVGGTRFSGDGSDTYGDQYWNSSTTVDIINSAIKYIPETTWNDSAADGDLSSSGGGVSTFYTTTPSWQVGLFSGQPSGRMVPDISFTASADHDGYLICTQNFPSTSPNTPASNPGSTCVDGFRISPGGDLTPYGGTSAAAQVFSGLMTLLVQARGPQGNINTKLYSLAKNATTYAEVFHDITSGNNIVPCTPETLLCVDYSTPPVGYTSSGYYVGYSASPGYDMATGLGSIDGYALYKALSPTASTTTLTVTDSPASVTYGATTALSATVTPASATGTVTFSLGSTTLGTATLSSGIASLPAEQVTAANGFSVGVETITANYSGDTNNLPSSASTTLTVSKAPLTVTANNAARLYGSANPTFAYTITGFVNGNSAGVVSGSASLTTTATASSAVGAYPITFSTRSLTATNYSFTYVSGTLVVYSGTSSSLPLPLLFSPASATANGAGFTLTVTGANFTAKSVVLWNGAVRTTTYASSTQLTAAISAADLASEATNLITVANTAAPLGTSSALPFAVMSATPVAAITAAAISDAASGGAYTLLLTGTDFVPTSSVNWNVVGSNVVGLATTYVSPWSITATITSSEYASLPTTPATLTVVNPAGTSAGFTLP